MKNYFLLLVVATCFSCPSLAQDHAYFSNIPNSNDFVYNDTGIDRIMQPGKYSAIFYGETHTRFFEPMFKYYFIRHMSEMYGIHDVFMEIGYAPAYLFNQFLATGDTSLIDLGVLYTSTNYMDMWKRLYAYNQTLPADKKIRIYGGDFETKPALKVLLLLKPQDKPVSAILQPVFAKIEALFADTARKPGGNFEQAFKEFSRQFNEIKKSFDQHQDEVTALYGDNMPLVRNILTNEITMTDPKRNEHLYTHLQAAIKENHIAKFVGFFGADHVRYDEKDGLPNALKKDAQYKGRVATIQMFCFNAYDNWSHETLECIGTYDEKEGTALHKRYAGNYRAVMVSAKAEPKDMLKHSADLYLFANDR